jgi:chromosome segregation ATPase
MISLEQIRSLEQKVNLVIEQLNRSREENAKLRAKVKSTQTKTADLESIVNRYKQEQSAIEKGILSVLSKLDKLEDEVSFSGAAPKKENAKPVLNTEEKTVAENKPAEKEAKKNAGAVRNKTAGAVESGPATPPGNKQDELDIF